LEVLWPYPQNLGLLLNGVPHLNHVIDNLFDRSTKANLKKERLSTYGVHRNLANLTEFVGLTEYSNVCRFTTLNAVTKILRVFEIWLKRFFKKIHACIEFLKTILDHAFRDLLVRASQF
jgi:hypothetical protein